jgi:hypothetical protein
MNTVKDDAVGKTSTNHEKVFHSCGIWPMASYINHSCNSNARRAFIGDMMIVRAAGDLPSDTELTFWYHLPTASGYDERQKRLQSWNFTCDCTMCQDDQTTKKSVFTQRRNLRADILNYFQSYKKTDVGRIEKMIASLGATYRRPAIEVPRLSVWDAHLGLAKAYMSRNQPIEAIDSALRVLTSLGYVIEGGNPALSSCTTLVVKRWGLMTDSLTACWLILANAYHLVAPSMEIPAKEYARISYRICVGEDETFDETYGGFPN